MQMGWKRMCFSRLLPVIWTDEINKQTESRDAWLTSRYSAALAGQSVKESAKRKSPGALAGAFSFQINQLSGD